MVSMLFSCNSNAYNNSLLCIFIFQPDSLVFNESFSSFIKKLVWQVEFSKDSHGNVYPTVHAAL